MVLWGTLALQSSAEALLISCLKFFPSSFTGLESVQKYLYVNGCHIDSFWLRIVIFYHKQINTMLRLWLKFQASILYRKKVIVFFRPVTFIRVYYIWQLSFVLRPPLWLSSVHLSYPPLHPKFQHYTPIYLCKCLWFSTVFASYDLYLVLLASFYTSVVFY